MRQSNLYIITYAAILAIVCAGLLVLANTGLKDRQNANIALEQKENILSAAIELKEGDDVNKLYAERVKEFVIDSKGNVLEGKTPKDIVIANEYKKPAEERMLPVYEFRNQSNPDKLDYVVLPVFGRGLWDIIWGFVALKDDMNTIQGVKYEHKGETPGLGARIETDEVQNRYKGKKVFEGEELASVTMMKGEGNDWSDNPHRVDGMSGATLTANGVNNMLKDYLSSYENYIKKNRKK